MNTKDKMLSLDQFSKLRDTLEDGVVLAHGVFDLLHSSHIDYLEKSKSHGKYLVVSLTDDPYVNKGPGRPYFNISQRLSVMASLNIVDFVLVSPESSSVTVINAVRPDYYSKGIEYRDKIDITGKIDLENNAVIANGGETVYVETDEILSSTKVINDQSFTSEFQKCIDKLKTQYKIEEVYEVIDKLKDIDLVIAGEMIIDEYIFGNAIGKSSKYPSIVFNKQEINVYDGGVIAVAKQLSSLVKSIKVITCVGDDGYSPQQLPSNVEFLPICKSNCPTIRKTRYIDSYYKSRLFETYDMNDRPLDTVEYELLTSLLSTYDDYLKIAIDYGHGFLNGNETLFSINAQSNAGNRGYNYISKFNHVQHMVLDEQEMRLENRDKSSDILVLSKDFYNNHDIKSITTTRGSNGCVIQNGDTIEIPAVQGNVLDTVGAGDAFFGIYSCLLSLDDCSSYLAGFLANIVGYMTANTIGHESTYNSLSLKQAVNTFLK